MKIILLRLLLIFMMAGMILFTVSCSSPGGGDETSDTGNFANQGTNEPGDAQITDQTGGKQGSTGLSEEEITAPGGQTLRKLQTGGADTEEGWSEIYLIE